MQIGFFLMDFYEFSNAFCFFRFYNLAPEKQNSFDKRQNMALITKWTKWKLPR